MYTSYIHYVTEAKKLTSDGTDTELIDRTAMLRRKDVTDQLLIFQFARHLDSDAYVQYATRIKALEAPRDIFKEVLTAYRELYPDKDNRDSFTEYTTAEVIRLMRVNPQVSLNVLLEKSPAMIMQEYFSLVDTLYAEGRTGLTKLDAYHKARELITCSLL